MDALKPLRWLVWASAGVGVFIAFAWPFLVSADPDDATLRLVARATTAILLLVLAAAAVLRARRRPGS